MKAMVFAAGLGTRLRPLTNDKPKALVEINGMPLIEIVIRNLKKHGYTDIVVNVHHFATKVVDFLVSKRNLGVYIHLSDERDAVLETGGGLKKAAHFFENDTAPFLVWNTDILCDLDIADFRTQHIESGAIASLAVRNRETSRYLLFDDNHTLVGWKNTKTEEIKMSKTSTAAHEFAFSGIHMIQPDLLKLLPSVSKYSIIQPYLEIAKQHSIKGYLHNDSNWIDVGKKPAIPLAEQLVKTWELP